ncbi:MAG: hypothetical protein GH151_08285 [Bacteroidetes bacterium]|nr:hypothetical protein [Bacteroidota bacterium]
MSSADQEKNLNDSGNNSISENIKELSFADQLERANREILHLQKQIKSLKESNIRLKK